MENTETLKHMHKLHLVLADELKRICEKYHIRYFMIAGTLLGAVRHKGFIPWDDDMDFGMLRPDFEKFLEVCSKELDMKKFYLQTDRNDKYYTFNFAKLRLKGTRVIEKFSSTVDINQGIYIDIFPLDAVSDNPVKAMVQYKTFWIFRNLLWIRCGYGSEKRKKELLYKVVKFISQFCSIDFLKKKKANSITKYQKTHTKFVVTSDGVYGLQKETIQREWVMDLKNYLFEDRKYPGIENYDAYLFQYYGDYMKLPPENQRNHHGRLEVEFGNY